MYLTPNSNHPHAPPKGALIKQTTENTMETIKLRIMAESDNMRRGGVMFMGVEVAFAHRRDSGGFVGKTARMISGRVDSGGSLKNWHCLVEEGSIFEVEVDAEAYHKNKNRIQKWEIKEIVEFSVTLERAKKLEHIENNLE